MPRRARGHQLPAPPPRCRSADLAAARRSCCQDQYALRSHTTPGLAQVSMRVVTGFVRFVACSRLSGRSAAQERTAGGTPPGPWRRSPAPGRAWRGCRRHGAGGWSAPSSTPRRTPWQRLPSLPPSTGQVRVGRWCRPDGRGVRDAPDHRWTPGGDTRRQGRHDAFDRIVDGRPSRRGRKMTAGCVPIVGQRARSRVAWRGGSRREVAYRRRMPPAVQQHTKQQASDPGNGSVSRGSERC
jgi:hypothetical protein